MNKPIIGVLPLIDKQRDSIWMVPGYLDGLTAQNCIPIILPLHMNEDAFQELNQKIDGYLFTGGQDVAPDLYKQECREYCGEIAPERDCLEEMVYWTAYRQDKPILAICRGIQLINVLHGGSLYQDLERERNTEGTKLEHHMSAPYDRTVHGVRIIRDTPLYTLLGKDKLQVNSYHHQGIDKVGRDLCVMAEADDGLVEGVYAPDRRFDWAIQWHPEFIYKKDQDQNNIFARFVEACIDE